MCCNLKLNWKIDFLSLLNAVYMYTVYDHQCDSYHIWNAGTTFKSSFSAHSSFREKSCMTVTTPISHTTEALILFSFFVHFLSCDTTTIWSHRSNHYQNFLLISFIISLNLIFYFATKHNFSIRKECVKISSNVY